MDTIFSSATSHLRTTFQRNCRKTFVRELSNADKSKISFDKQVTEQLKKKKIGKSFSPPKTTKKVFLSHSEFCPLHPEQKLITKEISCKKVIIDIVFSQNGARKSVIEYSGWKGYCQVCEKHHKNRIYESHGNYGFNFKAWLIYQRVALQLPYTKINESLDALFGGKMSCKGNYANIIKYMANFYNETEDKIIANLRLSPFIHADETSININGNNQYIWTFTNDEYVVFKLSKNRESELAFNFLKDYKGVLITDFFSGYDSIPCQQQKCWVHFIRDLNNDLWENPFDKEYENFVVEIRNLMIPIIETVHKYGLKKHFLSKYRKNIDLFYKNHIDNKVYKSGDCPKSS